MVVPFGSFNGSGNALIPITGFAAFYITGYSSNGGFNNPCEGSDTFATGTAGDNGVVSGHFISEINPNEGNAGSAPCDTSQPGQCVAVLVK